MPYELDRMSALGFQDAAAALAVAEFGPIVRRLGRGKDGGRDMEANGVLVWSGTDGQPGEVWEGYSVFQVKHHEQPARNKADARWLWGEIHKELKAWADSDSNRKQVPKHLVIVSNVRLSPEPDRGGLDYVEEKIKQFFTELADTSQDVGPIARERQLRRQRLRALKKWKVVDGNQLDAWLDIHDGVRRAYGAFLMAGDVLADLIGLNPELPAGQLEPALQTHARSSLIRERNIYFDEAGGDGAGVPLDKIAVDLPVRGRATSEPARAIAYVLDRGEHVLKRSIATVDKPRHVVLTGAPGNGKTTVTRFLVQSYRAAMLAETANLAEDHVEAITGTAAKLKRLRRRLPTHRRWAVRVDLAEFAKGYVADERNSLMAFIARQVTAQGYTRKLEPWQLKAWMEAWPWFVALDGLDEVSEPLVRKWVIGCVHEFVADAEADDADLLCLVTTRPTGYVDEMSASQFDRLDLTDLTTSEALAYGHLVTEIRLRADTARIKRVDTLLRSAAENDALRHLLRTPLQIQIMTIIAEGAGPLDPDRFRLFWRYYDVVARREQTKENTRFAELLRDHGEQVLDLHERVGLELQRRSETADGGTATMSEDDLSAIAWHVLADEGYDPTGKDARLLERIVQAATHRLVLLVPRTDGYGFDVRSLQEMMAARRITTGELDTVLKRLSLLAPSPHWRNTWLFAAGRLFAEPQSHQHEKLIEMVETLDAAVTDRFSSIAPVGPYLAWDMLDDGMAAARPRWLRRLIDLGMTAIDCPAPQPIEDFAGLVMRMSEFADELCGHVEVALKASLIGDSSSRANAAALMGAIGTLSKSVTTTVDVRLLSQVKPEPGRSTRPDPIEPWEYFEEVIADLASDAVSSAVAEAATVVRAARTRPTTADELAKLEVAALDPEATELLEVALDRVVRVEPQVAALCFGVARTTTARRELASQLDQDRH
ncbi:hypothetical protein OHB24_17160 [Kribbella sp. NBC_00482]|uniref:NACHT domain-containing protein n=1 Tax=Kribbella sp. NBC_00482 TaxID=2975968 RepID=UPI002E178512